MDYLYQKLPKDLVNIVEEYAKDRTNYDKVAISIERYFNRDVIWSQIHVCVFAQKEINASKPKSLNHSMKTVKVRITKNSKTNLKI